MFVPDQLKTVIKGYLFQRWGVPYSPVADLPAVLAAYLRGKGPITLIDIGAHSGAFALAVDRYCGVARGVLVEANPRLSRQLSEFFSPPKWRVWNCALTAHPGPVQFHIQIGFDVTSSLLAIQRERKELAGLRLGETQVLEVQGRTLDQLVDEEKLQSLDLIKLDVQGAEHLVLEGGAEALRQTHMVWTEVSFKPLYEGSSTFPDIHGMLSNAGFCLRELAPGYRARGGELVQCDALYIREGAWK